MIQSLKYGCVHMWGCVCVGVSVGTGQYALGYTNSGDLCLVPGKKLVLNANPFFHNMEKLKCPKH